ncbi:MAG: hypothetical protein HZA49_03090 [Planctomycetes bacterium]|nr:hypothetical protein [Planctomycetota bacterium]
MTQKQSIKTTLIFGLFFISLGGWLLHLRVHSPSANSLNYIPFFIGLVNIVIIPWMFFFRRLIHWAYILNGMSVIVGIILMAHFSLGKLPPELSWGAIFLNTTLADIMLLCGKFVAGKALFDLEFSQIDKNLPVKSRFLRYPNLGWWLVHLAAIAAVYAIGAEVL